MNQLLNRLNQLKQPNCKLNPNLKATNSIAVTRDFIQAIHIFVYFISSKQNSPVYLKSNINDNL